VALLAAIAATEAAASSATFYAVRPSGEEDWQEAILASHLRATMSGHVIDVASSDRHTVKPWFDGKLAFAPEVIDLAPQGFPLVGGRIDVIDFQPVPTLVYRAGKHLVSVTAIPGGARLLPPAERDDRGFHTISWNAGSVLYVAVSDAAPEAIAALLQAFQTASRQ